MPPRMGIRRLGLRSLGGGRAGDALPPWHTTDNSLDGNPPSLYADFGRDKYALANVGPNIVTNGDFASGLGSWTNVSGIVTASAGVMRVAGDGSGGRAQYVMTGLTVGKVYVLTFNFQAFNGTNIVYAVSPNASSTPDNADMVGSSSSTGAKQLLFVANGTTRNILVAIGNTAVGNWADVSDFVVREIASTLGPNLVRNGDFDTNLTEWTQNNVDPATWSVTGGQAVVSSDGSATARLVSAVATIPGRTYVVSSTGTANTIVGTASSSNDILSDKAGGSRLFTASGATTYVTARSTVNGATFDNVSVREVLVGFGPELVTNSGFDNDLSGWTDASAAGASFSWQSGRAVATTDGVAVARLRTSVATVVGRTYRVACAGTGAILVGVTSGQGDIFTVFATEKTFVATTTTTYLSYSSVTNGLHLDYVSVREVLTNQPVQPVTFSELFALSSGAKTVVASDNTLKTVPANYPAFDYSSGKRALRLEGAATNLITRSVDIGSWTTSSVTVTQGWLSPDGVNNWRVITDATTSVIGNAGTGRTVAADTATYVYAMLLLKDPSATNNMQLVLMFSGGTTQDCRAVFDPRTGAVGATINCTSESIDFGAYCLIRLTAANNGTNTTLVNYIMPATNSVASAGYAQSVTQTGSVSVCHAQLEVGTVPSSPIFTNGSTATRITDVCAFSPLLNLCLVSQAATMAYRGNVKTAVASQQLVGLSGWGLLRGATAVPAQLSVDGSSKANVSLGSVIPGELGAAFAWDSSGRFGAANGGALASLSSVVDKQMPPFFFGGSTGMSSGAVHELGAFVVWPLKASNSNLEAQARAYA